MPSRSARTHERNGDAMEMRRLVPVSSPYRLDVTVAVLRRFSSNVVDVVSADGTYHRAHATPSGPRVVAVVQRNPESLEVAYDREDEAERVVAVVRRTLGLDRMPSHFVRAAAEITWLAAIASRMRGVRPPRYATLWEACVNAIVFQQVSLAAASAILGRVVVSLSEAIPVAEADIVVRPFPQPEVFIEASDASLRLAGLSVAKVATLRRVAGAIIDGSLDEATLEGLSSPDASGRLCAVKGIGPWTAAVILLRGLGRLDVFPENDSGVARSLLALTGTTVDIPDALARLAPEQGMLYYHLLLARLEARGDLAIA